MAIDVVDYTHCPSCGATADIQEDELGYYATCDCGRTTRESYDTIEEAVAAFKNDNSCE